MNTIKCTVEEKIGDIYVLRFDENGRVLDDCEELDKEVRIYCQDVFVSNDFSEGNSFDTISSSDEEFIKNIKIGYTYAG